MEIRVYLVSYLLLFAVNFGIAHTTIYSQEKDVVLAAGNPPLTQSMVDKTAAFLEWCLEIKLSPEQKSLLQKVSIRAWKSKSPDEMQSTLNLVEIHDKLLTMSDEERNFQKGQLQPAILKNLRSEPNDELSRILLSAYKAAHSTKPKTNRQSNSSSTITKSKLRVGADGFTGIHLSIHPVKYGKGFAVEYITFLPEGQVFWRLPLEGLLYFDPAVAHKAYPDDWGTYEIKKDEIHILRGAEKKPYVLTKNGDRFEMPNGSESKSSYRFIPPSDGLRLEGKYRLTETYPAITFTKNGKFNDEGFFQSTTGVRPDGTSYNRDIKGGSGTYLIEQNTLELKYSDGRIKRFPFVAFPEKLAKQPAVDSFILFYDYIMTRY